VATAKFLLEHFYYGQLVADEKPQGEPRLLGASRGVSPKLAEQAVERVMLPPLIRSKNGSWALVRGRSRNFPFLLTQSFQGKFGQVIHHYVLASPDVLKAVGGNLTALSSLVQSEMPVFEKDGKLLKPLSFDPGEDLSVDDQIDHILELMTVTKNRVPMIESMLAAIVQGRQLVIQGAPTVLEERIMFIAGLLALLPSSARFGVTFATHSLPSTDIDVQIRFYSDDMPPKDTVVFNWAGPSVHGDDFEDEYSRYVISQLRLDAELVIQRNTAMASIAAWRLGEGDKLAEALAYASKRVRLDDALRNNQPVDKDEVARVLSEDQTLSGELRVLYARHLVRFSLAMRDMQHAEPVAILLRGNPDLSQSIQEQMTEAINEGEAEILYDTLVSWMNNPLGPQGKAWVSLTHTALLSVMRDFVADNDVDAVNSLLQDVINAGPALALGQVAPRIVGIALPISARDAVVAENVFLVGVKYLNMDAFVKMMGQSAIREQLQPQVKETWAFLQSSDDAAPPDGLLVRTARAFGDAWEAQVLLRLVEIAVATRRVALIDTPTLQSLLRLVMSPERSLYRERILALVNQLDADAILNLDAPGPRYVLQIRLALGEYVTLAREMINQSVALYPGDLQVDYVKMVRELFAETPINDAEVVTALHTINENGIKALPFMVASVGVLESREASPELDEIAQDATDYLLREQVLLEVVPPGTIIGLLDYYNKARNVDGLIDTAYLVPLAAAHHGNAGVKLLSEMYKRMAWDDRAHIAAMQMLRVYVRSADEDVAQKVISYYGKELGPQVKRTLDVTYTLRQVMDGDLISYAEQLHAVVEFLYDTAAIYADSNRLPNQNTIYNALESLSGTLGREDKQSISENMMRLGQSIVRLGKQYRSARPRDEQAYIKRLLAGKTDPRSILDVFQIVAGVLNDGQFIEVDPPKMRTNYILEGRSSRVLKAEISAAARITTNVMAALLHNKSVDLKAEEIRDEIASMVAALADDKKRDLLTLAEDLQRAVDLISRIEEQGDARAFEDSGLGRKLDAGKQRPRNTLEFYRFVRGFYAARL